MTAVPLGLSNYIRNLGGTPPIVLSNLFTESDKSNLVDGTVHLQRPGLVLDQILDDSPVTGVFCQVGTFNGDFIIVAGSSVYRYDRHTVTRLGTISADGLVQFACSDSRVLIATGSTCYSTDGVTVTTVSMPDGEDVQSVAFINGYFILTVFRSDRFFWIAPGQTDPDALSFASAENSPDGIEAVAHIGDELWFFGVGDSTEVWIPTGQANLPFQRVEGRLYNKGCFERNTVAKLDNTLFWMGSDRIVYRGDSVPIRISDNSIEELIYSVNSKDLSAWVFAFQGHTFYCLSLGQLGTRVYDVSTQTWVQFATYGRDCWDARVGATGRGGFILTGNDISGRLFTLDPTVSNDHGRPMVREVMGGVAVLGNPVPCGSVSLYVATGRASANPPADDPVMQMRYSDSGGNIWSAWRNMRLGKRGEYGSGVIGITRLGTMRPPGRLFHFRVSEEVLCRISWCRVNEYQA